MPVLGTNSKVKSEPCTVLGYKTAETTKNSSRRDCFQSTKQSARAHRERNSQKGKPTEQITSSYTPVRTILMETYAQPQDNKRHENFRGATLGKPAASTANQPGRNEIRSITVRAQAE
jgi:hypothetical protein